MRVLCGGINERTKGMCKQFGNEITHCYSNIKTWWICIHGCWTPKCIYSVQEKDRAESRVSCLAVEMHSTAQQSLTLMSSLWRLSRRRRTQFSRRSLAMLSSSPVTADDSLLLPLLLPGGLSMFLATLTEDRQTAYPDRHLEKLPQLLCIYKVS